MNIRVSEPPLGGVWIPTQQGSPHNLFQAFNLRNAQLRAGQEHHALLIQELLAVPPRESLGSEDRRQLASIALEPNAELFSESLYAFGRRQESRRHYGLASACYSAVERDAPLETQRNRARERLEVLRGGGSFGNQVEFVGLQVADQTLDPALLAGMALAGPAFETFRLASFSRLALSPAVRGVGGRLGAQGLALAAGFAFELPTFTFAVRGVRELLGQSQDWGLPAVGRDLLSNGLGLFSLKIAGRTTRSLVNRYASAPTHSGWVTRFSRGALPQGAMFAGLLGAQALEASVGLHEPTDSRSAIIRSLATLISFNVGSQLLSGWTASTYRRFQATEARIDRSVSPNGWRPTVVGFPHGRLAVLGPSAYLGPPILQMSGKGGESSPPPKLELPVASRAENTAARDADFQRIKREIDLRESDILRLQTSSETSLPWGTIMLDSVKDLLPLTRSVRDWVAKDPSQAKDVPFMDDILLELTCIEQHLSMGELTEKSRKPYFPPSENLEVQRFLTFFYRFTNKYINFLDQTDSAIPALNHLRYAHNWLRKSLNIGSGEHRALMATAKDFPYLRAENGLFQLPESTLNVVVLGDGFGPRTAELALKGHRVIHIDPDLRQLKVAQLALARWEREARASGQISHDVHAHFVHGDLDTAAEGDLIEAYYPSSFENLSPRSSSSRPEELTRFLNGILNSKLTSRGSGFILTDRDDVIEDLAEIIEKNPALQLLEVTHRSTSLPLLGGKAAVAEKGEELVSWIVYRKRSLSSLPPPPGNR